MLPASLTSIQEVMKLAGAHHITVSPPLLIKLAETPANPWEGDTGSVFTNKKRLRKLSDNNVLDIAIQGLGHFTWPSEKKVDQLRKIHGSFSVVSPFD